MLCGQRKCQCADQKEQTYIHSIPGAENSQMGHAQTSKQLAPVLLELNSIGNIDSPRLEDIRDLSHKLGRTGFNSSQRKHIEAIVSRALEGKEVLWQLRVNAVRETPHYFYPETISPGGLWVEPMIERRTEWCPSLHVECQTFNSAAYYLQQGESVIVSGRITKADLLWSSFILIVSDTVFARTSEGPCR